MLAELTLDMETIVNAVKGLAAVSLLSFAGFNGYRYLMPKSRLMAAKLPADEHKRKESGRSSDAPPPVGFAEHLQIIEKTAPNAGPEVWWNYAKSELTEAEVAIAEAKLANHNKQ